MIDWAERKANARAYLAVRTVVREPYTDERGRLAQRWVETSHYRYDFESEGSMYLMWQDLDPKKTDERKVAEARARYAERFGVEAAEAINKAPGLWWLGPIGG